jgi:hypothetical protein
LQIEAVRLLKIKQIQQKTAPAELNVPVFRHLDIAR